MLKSFLFIALAVVFSIGGLTLPASAQSLEIPGVENFHQVGPNVYRGAQPSAEGLKHLADLGVKTIVDLRHGKDHSDAEEKEAELFGLHYINVPMEGHTAPTAQQISSLLGVMDGNQGPVFVHCREGKDRTGAVIACYRIAHDHWTNDKALAEARTYGLHADQHPRQNYILNFEAGAAK